MMRLVVRYDLREVTKRVYYQHNACGDLCWISAATGEVYFEGLQAPNGVCPTCQHTVTREDCTPIGDRAIPFVIPQRREEPVKA